MGAVFGDVGSRGGGTGAPAGARRSDELFRFFTLTPGGSRSSIPAAGVARRIGLGRAVTLCTWLRFVPEKASAVAVAMLVDQLGVTPGALWFYGNRVARSAVETICELWMLSWGNFILFRLCSG
ncbi:hypothetical protein GCM10010428_25210 [Actinosynnema pretiosum subsp. pretiosum]